MDEAATEKPQRRLTSAQREWMRCVNELYFPSEKPKGEQMIEEDDDIQDYKRPWVGLTEEEIAKTYWQEEPFKRPTPREFARAVEQMLKEKNNG